MVAAQQRIGSAYFVIFGNYGDVTRYAEERGVCRQWVYREAASLQQALAEQQKRIERLQGRLRELEQQHTDLQERLRVAVVLDADKQAQFASVGQACGVSLPVCWELLDVLIAGQQQSVATLGRASNAAGKKAGELLPILDAWAQERVREVAADEIYVKDAVLMTVEPESLCWLGGRLSAEVSGAAWAQEFGHLPNLEQVTRDGGQGLAKGVALVNAQRQEQGQPAVVDQGDHFHALRGGSVGVRKAERQARTTLAAAEAADKELAQCDRQGQNRTGPTNRARVAWQKAEQAMDSWSERERLWQQTKEALLLVTPTRAPRRPRCWPRPYRNCRTAISPRPSAWYRNRRCSIIWTVCSRKSNRYRFRRKSSRPPCGRRVCAVGRSCCRVSLLKRRPCAGCCC